MDVVYYFLSFILLCSTAKTQTLPKVVVVLVFRYIYFYYVKWVVLLACLSGHHVCAVPTEAKEDSLDLEVWMVVNYHVGAGTKPGSSRRAANALIH